jgi:hypothetical protein
MMAGSCEGEGLMMIEWVLHEEKTNWSVMESLLSVHCHLAACHAKRVMIVDYEGRFVMAFFRENYPTLPEVSGMHIFAKICCVLLGFVLIFPPFLWYVSVYFAKLWWLLYKIILKLTGAGGCNCRLYTSSTQKVSYKMYSILKLGTIWLYINNNGWFFR